MAWTTATYAGQRATGSPSLYRTSMFELCRAINEREAAMGAPATGFALTKWYKPDGTQTENITMDQLLHLPCTGANSYAELNLDRMRTTITGWCSAGYFTEDSGVSDLWTVANLSTAIGYDLTVPVAKVNQAAFWQAIQDALDLLVHVYGRFAFTSETHTSFGRSDAYSTAAAAWAARDDFSDTHGFGARLQLNNVSGSWRAAYTESMYYTTGGAGAFRLGPTSSIQPSPSGTIAEAILQYRITGSELNAVVPYSVEGASGNIVNGSSNLTSSLTPWTLGATKTVTFSITVPSSTPYTDPGPPPTERGASATVSDYAASGADILTYIDIASELTDQA